MMFPFSLGALVAVLAFAVLPTGTDAFLNPIDKVLNDYYSLTTRVTARHILLPPNAHDACLKLKRCIMRRAEGRPPLVLPGQEKKKKKDDREPRFVVDAFEDAAKAFSRDPQTSHRGGLLGELLPPGSVCPPILDQKCFEAPLGALYGPVESEVGVHLLLVTERQNRPDLDGIHTRLVRTTTTASSSEDGDGDSKKKGEDEYGTLMP